MNTHTQLHVASKVLNLTLEEINNIAQEYSDCLLYTSPSPRDKRQSRMPSSA